MNRRARRLLCEAAALSGHKLRVDPVRSNTQPASRLLRNQEFARAREVNLGRYSVSRARNRE